MNKVDLDKFSKPIEVVIPLVNGIGVYKGRKIRLHSDHNGYFKLKLGDGIERINKADLVEAAKMMLRLPLFRGIVYGNSIIPFNFSAAKFLGYGETIPCYFLNADLGMVVKTRRWEDGNLFYENIDTGSKHQMLLVGIKEKVDKNKSIEDVKGITPEMRFFYLLMMLDKQRIEEWKNLEKLEIGSKEREKRIEQFKKSFAGRLQTAIENAGGKLIRFNRKGDRVDVKWKVGGETFFSTIDQNFRMLDLGFCAEGHDKDHSISSAIVLAEQFIDEGVIYKTRE